MKLLSWQTALLTRLIFALTLLFIIPVGLASAIGSTIPAQNVSFILTQAEGKFWVRHLHLLDMRSSLIAKIPNDAITNTALWSPDGMRMAYRNSDDQAFVWDISNKVHYPLTHSDSNVMIRGWSADSNTILLNFWQQNLYLVQWDGSESRKLPIPEDGFILYENADLSPDGRFVVFTGYGQLSDSEIYRFDIDENRLTQLTNSTDSHNQGSSLSPDGGQIAYLFYDVNGYIELFNMNTDGSHQQQLMTWQQGLVEKPQWSPDGRQLVLRHTDYLTAAQTLYVVKTDGTEQRKLINYTSSYGFYSWSPDGKYILYEADVNDETSKLYLIPVEGGEPRLLYGKDFEWVSFSSWQSQP
jgi:Tol biopolymer transport system component